MQSLDTILLVLLLVAALPLIGLILVQQGKGADMGAAFGSGAASTLFGSGGSSSFLNKFTIWLAIAFFIITFGLAHLARQQVDAESDYGVPEVVTSEITETPDEETEAEAVNEATDEVPASDVPTVQFETETPES